MKWIHNLQYWTHWMSETILRQWTHWLIIETTPTKGTLDEKLF